MEILLFLMTNLHPFPSPSPFPANRSPGRQYEFSEKILAFPWSPRIYNSPTYSTTLFHLIGRASGFSSSFLLLLLIPKDDVAAVLCFLNWLTGWLTFPCSTGNGGDSADRPVRLRRCSHRSMEILARIISFAAASNAEVGLLFLLLLLRSLLRLPSTKLTCDVRTCGGPRIGRVCRYK